MTSAGANFTTALVVSLLLTAAAFAQPLTPQQSAAIDAVFAEQKITLQSPGCGLALIRAGEIAHFKGYGLADVEKGEEWTPRTGFHTGSMFKHFYTSATVMLAREGKLSLDDDVRKYLPELPDYGARITIRNLLTHTHGLREYPALVELMPAEKVREDSDIMRLLTRQKSPNEPPGTRLRYGNTGPFLAGQVVERVSGLTIGEFIARRILEPFGMASTTFRDSRKVPSAAHGYMSQDNGSFTPRTDASFRTTFEDLARWDGKFERPEEEWRSVLDVITAAGTLNDGTKLDMAMGLRVRPYRGLRRVWAPGGARGYRAMFMRFPDQDFTIALGCNRDDVEPVKIAEAVAEVVLAGAIRSSDREPAVRPVRISRRHARSLTGTYLSDAYVLRVIERAGRLYMVSDRGEFEMLPVGADRFIFHNRPFIVRDAATEVRFRTHGRSGRSLVLHTLWDPAEFTKIRPVDPSVVRPSDYVGTFRSDELETEIEIRSKESGLQLKTARGEFPLEVLSSDVFRAGPQILSFLRHGGKVSAVSLSRGNLPGLLFGRSQ